MKRVAGLAKMLVGLPALVVGCMILLAVVGVIAKLLRDNIGRDDTCPDCSAALTRGVRICPSCRRALARGSVTGQLGYFGGVAGPWGSVP